MGLWSWLRGSTPAAPATPAAVPTPAPTAADPGWRAVPPVQRVLADGAPSVAGLGGFAASLATWQSPRTLTGLEHGRGPSAPAGTVAGIVDAASGAPGPTTLAASPTLVPLHGGSSGGAADAGVVQRSVRFDGPRRATVQRAVEPAAGDGLGGGFASTSAGGPYADERSEFVGGPSAAGSFADVPFGSGSAWSGPEPSGAGSSVVPAGSQPSGAAPSGEPAGAEPSGATWSGATWSGATSSDAASTGATSFGTPASGATSSGTTASDAASSGPVGSLPQQSEPVGPPVVAQRSAADRPSATTPTLGGTPLQRTLADASTPPRAPASSGGRSLPQLPVVPDRAVTHSFVTAPPQPSARAALPVVADLQRSVGSTVGVSSTAAVPTATPDLGTRSADALPVTVLPSGSAVDVHTNAGAGPVVGTPASPTTDPAASVDPVPTGSAPLLADAPPALQVASDAPDMPTVSRSTGAAPASRHLGLGAPLARPPRSAVPEPGVAAPVVQTFPAGPTAGSADVPARAAAPAPAPAPEPATAPKPTTPHSAAPQPAADVETLPEPEPPSYPEVPEHGVPLLGERPLAPVLPPVDTQAVQRSAVAEVVPIRWDPPAGASGSAHSPAAPAPAAIQRSAAAPASPTHVAGRRAGPDPGTTAVQAGIAHRDADGSVVFHPPVDGPAPVALQRFGLPSVPKLPSLPSAPSLPSLPSLPAVPSLPSLPSGLPSLPSLPTGLPSLPSVPSLPSLPNLPSLPSGLPSIPSLPGLPSGLPSMPNLPDLPAFDHLRDRAESAATGALGQATDMASSAVDTATGAVGNALDTAQGAVGTAIDSAQGAVGGAVDTAKGAVGGAVDAAKGAASGALAATSTDELVRRLFDPLAARLKAELRLDRERAGFVTDLRR